MEPQAQVIVRPLAHDLEYGCRRNPYACPYALALRRLLRLEPGQNVAILLRDGRRVRAPFFRPLDEAAEDASDWRPDRAVLELDRDRRVVMARYFPEDEAGREVSRWIRRYDAAEPELGAPPPLALDMPARLVRAPGVAV